MADDADSGDKTEDPTPKRLQKAREDGDVAKSNDLSGAVLLMGMLMLLWLAGGPLFGGMMDATRATFGEALSTPQRSGDAGAAVLAFARHVGPAAAALAGGAVVLAALAHLVQTGPMLAPKKLEPKLSKLNPISGAKNIFFEPKTYVQFLMGLAKIGVVSAVAVVSVRAHLPEILGLGELAPPTAFGAGAWVVFMIGVKVAGALLLLAILDFAYQKYRHKQQLKMTKQQVKEELKSMEGDPQMKSRRRQIAQQRAMERAKTAVPSADFVVTNPTHFAVALKYDAAAMHAPTCVAKGADRVALRIRELAAAHKVPIVEKPPLARALWKDVGVGEPIPEAHYAAVAEILAYVYEMDAAAGKAARARAAKKSA